MPDWFEQSIGKLKDILVDTQKVPFLDQILNAETPVTTSLSDAHKGFRFLDDFNPLFFGRLRYLPRTPDGAYVLQPGLFEIYLQSYCIKAGTYRPSEGEGYLYAPLKGPCSDIIQNILRRSQNYPELNQEDIQMILWAIIARTKMSDIPPESQSVAQKLITPDEMFRLNGGAIGLIPEEAFEILMNKLPPQLQDIIAAEAQIREMMTGAQVDFESLEQVVFLTGERDTPRVQEIPRGRWCYHNGGFFIRYLPDGYNLMQIQLYVPEQFPIDRDPKGRIVSVAQPNGNKIELTYNDDAGPINVPSDDGIRGWKFRSIRFIHQEVMTPKGVFRQESEWHDIGWSFTGVPSGSAKIETRPSALPDLKNRYTTILGQIDDLNALIDKVKPKRERLSRQELFETAINLGHLSYALHSALVEGGAEKLTASMQEHLDLLKKAWQYTVSSLIEGPGVTIPSNPLPLPITLILQSGTGNSGTAPTYDPSGDVATPADTSSQRIALSNIASADNEKKAGCNTSKFLLAGTLITKYAYENESLLKLAQNNHADGFQYQGAVEYYKRKSLDDFLAHMCNEGTRNDGDAMLNAAEQARPEYTEHDPSSIPYVGREDLIKILRDPNLEMPDQPYCYKPVTGYPAAAVTTWEAQIYYNKGLFFGFPPIFPGLPAIDANAIIEHEKQHKSSYGEKIRKWGSEGFWKYMKDPANWREEELRAYDVQISYQKRWMKEFDCL